MKSRNRHGRCCLHRPLVLIVTATLIGCNDARNVAPSTVVDSVLPLAEEIRRFRGNESGPPVTHLTGGAALRDSLVDKFVRAVEQTDTTALIGLLINRMEFIDIYFPVSVYAKPPYRQSPAFVWFQFQQNSAKGLQRLLDRYGRAPLGFVGYECNPQPAVQGASRLWQGCRVEWRYGEGTIQLFGTILEHAGRFKFVSYANDL